MTCLIMNANITADFNGSMYQKKDNNATFSSCNALIGMFVSYLCMCSYSLIFFLVRILLSSTKIILVTVPYSVVYISYPL